MLYSGDQRLPPSTTIKRNLNSSCLQEEERQFLCALEAGDATPCRPPRSPLSPAWLSFLGLAGLMTRATALVAVVAILATTVRKLAAARRLPCQGSSASRAEVSLLDDDPCLVSVIFDQYKPCILVQSYVALGGGVGLWCWQGCLDGAAMITFTTCTYELRHPHGGSLSSACQGTSGTCRRLWAEGRLHQDILHRTLGTSAAGPCSARCCTMRMKWHMIRMALSLAGPCTEACVAMFKTGQP